MSYDIQTIIGLLKSPSKKDIELITHAFDFAQTAHTGQERYSGEPYFIHPFETAKTLALLNMDAPTIAGGLLHDVCEDCLVTGTQTKISEKDIKKEFGEEVAFLVAGVTKLGTLKYRGEESKIENLRKMFLAMAKDIRVVLIKLADRLHNMQTIHGLEEKKQKRLAMETLEVYAPIANRLGMGKIKGQLEDLSFPVLFPKEHAETKKLAEKKYDEAEKKLAITKYKLKDELEKSGIVNAKIESRIKHLYSLNKKLQRQNVDMNIERVNDLVAIRIIVDTIEECYRALGVIHNMWRPLPQKIKDYIAVPKPNGYQSLHTTVFAEGGKITEIQIRTKKMHSEAEHGIAAHWAYTEGGKPKKGAKINPRLAWVNQLTEWQKEEPHSKEFAESLRIDFFNDRIFCYTPMGDVIDLPEGASAVDFAYAVHSDIGNSANGAIVNNKFTALNTILKNGDIVEIKTQKNKKPSREWLEHTKTSFARRQIKSSLKI